MSSSTPSIRISQHPRYHSPPTCPTYYSPTASVMAIPRAQEPVPPPLPPPSFIPEISAGHDPGWQWGNDPNGSDFGRAVVVKPGSSLLGGGGMKTLRQEKEHDFISHPSMASTRRGSSTSTITLNRDREMTEDHLLHSDEDGSSSRRLSNYRYVYCVLLSKTEMLPSSRHVRTVY